MNKQKKYSTKFSGQISRKRMRNAEKNRPRLEQLKEVMGCYQCGRSDVPGRYLDAHHVYGKKSKHKPLAHHCYATWRKVIDELLGIDREQGRSGGPCVPVCQRFHEDEIKLGDKAKPCTHECFKGVSEPYRVSGRISAKLRDMLECEVHHVSTKPTGGDQSKRRRKELKEHLRSLQEMFNQLKLKRLSKGR